MIGTSSDLGVRARRGDFVLTAARYLYLGVALVSFLIALVALVTAGYFELRSWLPAKQLPVPPLYRVAGDSLDLSIIDSHFTPPKNIHFTGDLYVVTQALNGQEIFGHFEADTANGLARSPEDIDIIGGPDAGKFVRSQSSDKRGHSGLMPSAALVAEINRDLDTVKSPVSRTYTIQVVARDIFANLSAPANISFKLYLAPPGTTSDTPDPNLSPLESLALDIAQFVDPTHGVRYIDAFKRVKAVPAQCLADSDDALFVANFRRAYQHIRPRLEANKLEQFYLGVCDGWNDVGSKLAASRAAQTGVVLKNAISLAKAEQAADIAKMKRTTKLFVAGGAFVFFMFISLLLAFLAIEGHTRAMREVMEYEKSKTP